MATETPDIYLKFEGTFGGERLTGDCTDEHHPGEEGWIQIKSFTFGFGAEEKGDSFEAKTGKSQAKSKEEIAKDEAAKKAAAEKKAKDLKSWGKSGEFLNFEKFSFSKSTDRLSPVLSAMCHHAKHKIDSIEVQAVRYGGTGKDFKIPFIKLTFEKVRLKSFKLNLSNDSLPTEDIEFEYDIVTMESLWTDNATGDRLPERPLRAGWNIPKHEQSALSWT